MFDLHLDYLLDLRTCHLLFNNHHWSNIHSIFKSDHKKIKKNIKLQMILINIMFCFHNYQKTYKENKTFY